MNKSFLVLVIILISLSFICAHQPRFTMNKILSEKNPYQVENPEISQAFYGELKGEADHYIIDSETDFSLYLNLLAPDTKETRKDFQLDIVGKNISLNGGEHNWTLFYEEFAGDNYWRGPELEKEVSAGIYLIRVYNKNNLGKYSLAIGKIEAFDFKESLNAMFIIPVLKIRFFEKNIFSLLEGRLGPFIIGAYVIFIIILFAIIKLVIFLVRKFQPKNSGKIGKKNKKSPLFTKN